MKFEGPQQHKITPEEISHDRIAEAILSGKEIPGSGGAKVDEAGRNRISELLKRVGNGGLDLNDLTTLPLSPEFLMELVEFSKMNVESAEAETLGSRFEGVLTDVAEEEKARLLKIRGGI
jgi:hypothetical protein